MIYNRSMSWPKLRLIAAALLAGLMVALVYLALREMEAATHVDAPSELTWRPAVPEDLFRGVG